MIVPIENPAARTGANRVSEIVATAKQLDVGNPIETPEEVQSEKLAIQAIMKRFPVSMWHAQVICRASGLGGAA